jgi:hypothetical protein
LLASIQLVASMLFSPDEYRTARQALYERLFGPIDKVFHSTDVRSIHIDIYRFAPTPARPFWTLVSGGMSDLRQPALEQPPDGVAPRAELIMYVRQPEDWMFAVLKGLAEMPFEHTTCLHWGHTVPNGVAMTPEPSELTSFFFVPPKGESSELAKFSIGGDRVDFLILVPITESERAYAVEHGSAALVRLMDDSGFQLVVDKGRKSLV